MWVAMLAREMLEHPRMWQLDLNGHGFAKKNIS